MTIDGTVLNRQDIVVYSFQLSTFIRREDQRRNNGVGSVSKV